MLIALHYGLSDLDHNVMASTRLSADESNTMGVSSGSAVNMLPTPKRHKISLACNVCRVRKSKCDGIRPGMS
jgi:hypothetical protein